MAKRCTPLLTRASTNARIVTVSGQTIERGTVVVRDGLIAAVGASVNPPPDARIIDGTGLTVYPGIIDASTTLGIPRLSPSPAAGGGGGGGFAGGRVLMRESEEPWSIFPGDHFSGLLKRGCVASLRTEPPIRMIIHGQTASIHYNVASVR